MMASLQLGNTETLHQYKSVPDGFSNISTIALSSRSSNQADNGNAITV